MLQKEMGTNDVGNRGTQLFRGGLKNDQITKGSYDNLTQVTEKGSVLKRGNMRAETKGEKETSVEENGG